MLSEKHLELVNTLHEVDGQQQHGCLVCIQIVFCYLVSLEAGLVVVVFFFLREIRTENRHGRQVLGFLLLLSASSDTGRAAVSSGPGIHLQPLAQQGRAPVGGGEWGRMPHFSLLFLGLLQGNPRCLVL